MNRRLVRGLASYATESNLWSWPRSMPFSTIYTAAYVENGDLATGVSLSRVYKDALSPVL